MECPAAIGVAAGHKFLSNQCVDMPDNSEPGDTQSWAKFKRELREEQRRCGVDARLRMSTDLVVAAIQHVHGRHVSVDRATLREVMLEKLPPLEEFRATRHCVATHEIGHFVSYQAEGLNAATASIRSTPGDPRGWGGYAKAWDTSWLEPANPNPNAEDFNRYARAIVAGPVSEELVGGGKTLPNIAELMSARVYSDRAASLLNDLSGPVWVENVRRATATVEHYAPQIHALSEMLAKRREVASWQPSVRRILRTIEPRLPATWALSPVGTVLSQRIISAVPSTAKFMTKDSR